MKSFFTLVLSAILTLNISCLSLFQNISSFYLNTSMVDELSSEVDLGITSKSAILIEAETGRVLYEKNSDERLKPASVTKIMTLLLIFDSIKSGAITLEDTVIISEHAASMGGSQCFFEAGEEQKVMDMIKCIEVSSGNDAAVAMGEHLAGSEPEFVKQMNEKAHELGMENTNFVNACGLDDDNHYTSARDIGIMSRELITKHPEIFEISTIWMDYITHKTSKGESRFDLANTNKFLRQYTGANGLKTGYTSEAGYCISATATRDDITLIAVIMGAETKEIRNSEAGKLLDYGFSKCKIYTDSQVVDNSYKIKIMDGVMDYTYPLEIKEHKISMLDGNIDDIKKEICVYDDLKAPIKQGDEIGVVKYSINGEVIEEIKIFSAIDIEKKSYGLSIRDLCNYFFVVE